MSQKFLLPCSCGEHVVVEPRQAGTQVTCTCGKPLEVPTIRGITKLAPASDQSEVEPPIWGLWQGLVFLGLMIALPALAFGYYQYRQIPTLNETMVKEHTMHMEPAQTWYLWKVYEQGMPKVPSVESAAIIRGIQTMRMWINIALGVAACGLLISAAGLMVRWTRPPATVRVPARAARPRAAGKK